MRIDRVWAMPNSRTFTIPPIRRLVEETLAENPGEWIDPFAGNSTYCQTSNDFNPATTAKFHLLAEDFLSRLDEQLVTYAGMIIDPPYSPRQIKECYNNVGLKPTAQETSAAFWAKLKDHAARLIPVGGVVIMCGWNSNGVGVSRGFEKERLLLIGHGGTHNDTIVTVERKVCAGR